jgi:hypothetical protein
VAAPIFDVGCHSTSSEPGHTEPESGDLQVGASRDLEWRALAHGPAGLTFELSRVRRPQAVTRRLGRRVRQMVDCIRDLLIFLPVEPVEQTMQYWRKHQTRGSQKH